MRGLWAPGCNILGEGSLDQPLPFRGPVRVGVLKHARACRVAWIVGTLVVSIIPLNVDIQPNRGGL